MLLRTKRRRIDSVSAVPRRTAVTYLIIWSYVSGGLDPASSGGGARGAQASAWFPSDLAFQKSCGGAASFASVSRVRSCCHVVRNRETGAVLAVAAGNGETRKDLSL